MATKAESIRLIRKAYSALAAAHIPASWGFAHEKLYDMNAASERQHRRFMTDRRFGVTIADAARLFTVRHLAESLEKPDRYTVADILSIRTECLYAQAFVAKHGPAIRAAFEGAGLALADILALDYAELV